MADNPRGFVEHRNLNGMGAATSTRKRAVKADKNPHQIFAGDPVVLVSGNTVQRIASIATAAALPVLGVVRAIHDSNDRPLTHNLPTAGIFLPISTAGFVYVNEDPHQTYLVNTDSTVLSTHIGQFVDVTADTPNTAAGRSGMTIDLSAASNTAAQSLPFQIVEIGANNLNGIVQGESNQDVEVIIADHAWHSTNKIR